MGFGSFFSHLAHGLGQFHTVLRSFDDVINLVAYPVLTAAGVPPILIPAIIHGIQLAEATPATGSEKKALVLDAVATAISAANAVKPDTVDPAVTTLVSNGIDLTIEAINAVHKRPVAVTPPPAA